MFTNLCFVLFLYMLCDVYHYYKKLEDFDFR